MVQLTSKEPLTYTDLQQDSATLAAAGVAHGDLVYLLYHFERDVAPVYKRPEFEQRPYGGLYPHGVLPCVLRPVTGSRNLEHC